MHVLYLINSILGEPHEWRQKRIRKFRGVNFEHDITEYTFEEVNEEEEIF